MGCWRSRGTCDLARRSRGWRGMEPPSTTLCVGYAGGLAAIVDRGSTTQVEGAGRDMG